MPNLFILILALFSSATFAVTKEYLTKIDTSNSNEIAFSTSTIPGRAAVNVECTIEPKKNAAEGYLMVMPGADRFIDIGYYYYVSSYSSQIAYRTSGSKLDMGDKTSYITILGVSYANESIVFDTTHFHDIKSIECSF